MLALLSADDPEIWINNTIREVAHPYSAQEISSYHAFHARELKERADAVRVGNIKYYGKNPVIYSDPSNENWTAFCKRKINK